MQHRAHTLLRRLQALFVAPLLGIAPLTGFDTHEQPLPTLLGRAYHRATLTQFLGQLERIDAAVARMPALVPAQAGQIISVDGPLIASWTRVPRHKGKSTMLGRIRAGSHAVIAHNAAAQALFVAYHPPDVPLSQVIVESCHTVAVGSGTSLCVIDRAVKAVAMACAFAKQGLGLLCLLDDHEHEGLQRFEATLAGTLEDGTKG